MTFLNVPRLATCPAKRHRSVLSWFGHVHVHCCRYIQMQTLWSTTTLSSHVSNSIHSTRQSCMTWRRSTLHFEVEHLSGSSDPWPHEIHISTYYQSVTHASVGARASPINQCNEWLWPFWQPKLRSVVWTRNEEMCMNLSQINEIQTCSAREACNLCWCVVTLDSTITQPRRLKALYKQFAIMLHMNADATKLENRFVACNSQSPACRFDRFPWDSKMTRNFETRLVTCTSQSCCAQSWWRCLKFGVHQVLSCPKHKWEHA